MTDDWIEDQALRFEGFTDAEIAQIEAAIPKFQSLLVKIKVNEAFFNGLVAEVEALLPTVNLIITKLKGRLT